MCMTKRFVISAIGLVFGCAVASASANACSTVFDPTFGTCTGANCSSERANGTVGSLGGGSTLPWCIRVFSFPDNCFRAEITGSDLPLEIVVVEPNGDVFRNTGLVKVASTSNQGWYTVRVSRPNGDSEFSNFQLSYGVYPLNNANCSNPTTVRSAVSRDRQTETNKSSSFGLFDPETTPVAD